MLLRALLVVLIIAALIGLGIVFAGGDDTVTRALISVLVLGAAFLLAVPAALSPRPALLWSMVTLTAIEAVLVWILIWTSNPAEGLGRAVLMIAVLLVIAAVAIVLIRAVTGPNLRLPRIVSYVSDVTGLIFLGMAWPMILTDGDAIPGRVLAGVAIIYATSTLAALVIALMRNYTVVRRA